MNEKSLEQLSSLMDDELGPLEAERAIIEAGQDPQVRAAWARFHVVRDAVRNQIPERVAMDFADRVRAAIDAEPVIVAPSRRPSTRLKPVAGLALAASVAAIAVLGVNAVSQRGGMESDAPAIAQSVSPPQSNLTASMVQIGRETEESMQSARLNSYLVNHNELRANLGMQGLMPYARIVGYEPQE